MEDPRQYVLRYLFEKCGFQFVESTDLSPETRQQVGALAAEVEGVWAIDSQIGAQNARMAKGTPWAGAPIALGVLLMIASVAGFLVYAVFSADLLYAGIVLVALGLVVSWRFRRKVAAVVADVQKSRDEQWRRWAAHADALSVKVVEETKLMYQQRVRPRVLEIKVDFAEIVRAAQGKGIVLDKVTCPSCGAPVLLPASGDMIGCTYCGNKVTATNVFEKMRSILS